MKFLFKRKMQVSPTEAENLGSIKDVLNENIHKVQKQGADWMQLKSEQLSIKVKWILFALFCLFTISGCVFLIIGSVSKKDKPNFQVNRIKTPVQLERSERQNPVLSDAEYEKIKHFKIYMDSLARSPDTRAEYERIQQQHPGLMDSIKTVEKFYQSQF